MISEHSTPKTQARAFSLLSFSGNVSIFLAPLLGGGLAKPADNFPLFARIPLFVKFPYLLPCLVTGVLAGIAAVVDLIWLKEVGRIAYMLSTSWADDCRICTGTHRPSSPARKAAPPKPTSRRKRSSPPRAWHRCSPSTCGPSRSRTCTRR